MSKMESVKIQMTKENIDTVKEYGSFARVVNALISLVRDDEQVQAKLKKRLLDLQRGD